MMNNLNKSNCMFYLFSYCKYTILVLIYNYVLVFVFCFTTYTKESPRVLTVG